MTSKWLQKCSPPQNIEPLTEKTWGQRSVIFGERRNKERNGETPSRRRKYFEWIIKQLLNSAFVGYEEFCRSRRVISTSVDNTLLDLQNSSYPAQPHSIIAKYEQAVQVSKILILSRNKKISSSDRPVICFLLYRQSDCFQKQPWKDEKITSSDTGFLSRSQGRSWTNS